MERTRRGVLGAAAAGVGAALAGCSSLDVLGGGRGATSWLQPRGTAGATGYSSTSGEVPTERAYDADLEGLGWPLYRRPPLVGEDAVYAFAAAPNGDDAETREVYASAFDREDGEQRWRTPVTSFAAADSTFRLNSFTCGLGPDAAYAMAFGRDGETSRVVVTRVQRDGSEVTQLLTEEMPRLDNPPVVDDGTLFFFDGDRRVTALSTSDGTVEYRTKPYVHTHPSQPPVVTGDDIVICNRGPALEPEEAPTSEGPEWSQVSVFDRDDGSHRWSTPVGYANSTPTVVDGTVYVVEGDFGTRAYHPAPDEDDHIPPRHVRALDLADGTEQWRFEYEREATKTYVSEGGADTLTVDSDTVYLALGFMDIRGRRMSESEAERVRERRYHGPNVFALDRGDGSVRWQTTLGDSAKVFAPTVVDDDHLYAYRWFDDGPTFHVLDKDDGSEVDTVDAGERADPGHFAVSNGALFQSTEQSVRCFR